MIGVTSTDASIRRLGKNWKRLHRIAYGLAVLGLLHYFMQSKANVGSAVEACGLFVWLMLWRSLSGGRQRDPAMLLAPAGSALLMTAGIEVACYGLATKVSVQRIREADLHIAYGLRPAAWVGIVALAVGGAILARHQTSRPKPPAAIRLRPVADQPSA
jgi:methionine sulfoxide reductase heme-binding subunit